MMCPSGKKIGIITGPTACGKSDLALEIARENSDIEIINADSVQIYKMANIGSAKPSQEVLESVPHHLVGILSPDEQYSAGEFLKFTLSAIEEIHSRGKRVLIVGGTGFYIKTLQFGMWGDIPSNPEYRNELEKFETGQLSDQLKKIDPPFLKKIGSQDRYRLIRALEVFRGSGKTPSELEESRPKDPDPRFEVWVIQRKKEELFSRIDLRTGEMFDSGWIEETKQIKKEYPDSKILKSVGYAQIISYLSGVIPAGRKIRPGLDGLKDEVSLANRQLVKKQNTWFNGQTHGQTFNMDSDKEKLLTASRELYD